MKATGNRPRCLFARVVAPAPYLWRYMAKRPHKTSIDLIVRRPIASSALLLLLFCMVFIGCERDKKLKSVHFLRKGMEEHLKGNGDQAIADFSKAIELNPQDAKGYHMRGVAWHQKRDLDKAISDLTKAIQMDPGDALAYYNRGVVWNDKGGFDEAIEDYTQYIKLYPDSPGGYYNRGCAWEKKGDLDRAIADYTQAIKMKSNVFDFYYNRGIAFYKKREFDQTFSDFTKAVEIRPEDANALSYLALILAASPTDNHRDGKRAVQLALNAVTRDANYFTLGALAAAYAENGKFEDAISTQEQAISLLVKQGKKEELIKYRECLRFYRAGKPWREK